MPMRVRRPRGPSAFLVALVLCLGLAPPSARATAVSHPAGFSLGLMLGDPTGVLMKQDLGGANAWDVGLGVGPGLRLHGDYLWGLTQLLSDTSTLTLDMYLGAGPVLGIGRGWCGTAYNPRGDCGGGVFGGVRVPFGLDARLTRAPVAFGLELAPGVRVGQNEVSELLDLFLFGRFYL